MPASGEFYFSRAKPGQSRGSRRANVGFEI